MKYLRKLNQVVGAVHGPINDEFDDSIIEEIKEILIDFCDENDIEYMLNDNNITLESGISYWSNLVDGDSYFDPKSIILMQFNSPLSSDSESRFYNPIIPIVKKSKTDIIERVKSLDNRISITSGQSTETNGFDYLKYEINIRPN